jgi:hypothetical protein
MDFREFQNQEIEVEEFRPYPKEKVEKRIAKRKQWADGWEKSGGKREASVNRNKARTQQAVTNFITKADSDKPYHDAKSYSKNREKMKTARRKATADSDQNYHKAPHDRFKARDARRQMDKAERKLGETDTKDKKKVVKAAKNLIKKKEKYHAAKKTATDTAVKSSKNAGRYYTLKAIETASTRAKKKILNIKVVSISREISQETNERAKKVNKLRRHIRS